MSGETMPHVGRVLEVVAHVGDAVGPRHHLALGGGGRGRDHEWLRMPSRVSTQRLSGSQHDVGAPHGVVVAPVDVGG
jgi:hypothetical protein